MNFGFRKHLLMNESVLGDSGGGAPPSDAPPITTSETPPDTYVPPEWAKGLTVEADILKAPMFSSVKDMNDVVKGYYHAQKLVGADKTVVPTKSSTPEQWKDYYVRAGLPADIVDYKPELPVSIDDPTFKEGLVKKAYELNIRPDQLSAIVAEMEGHNDSIVEAYQAEQANEIKATSESLKKEWGNDYQRNILQAQRVIKHFGGEETLQKIIASPLANDGDFLRLMAKVGGSLTKEDSFSQDVVTRFGTSKEDAQKQINAIYGNRSHAYFDDGHAQHKDAIAEMLKLQEILVERA